MKTDDAILEPGRSYDGSYFPLPFTVPAAVRPVIDKVVVAVCVLVILHQFVPFSPQVLSTEVFLLYTVMSWIESGSRKKKGR